MSYVILRTRHFEAEPQQVGSISLFRGRTENDLLPGLFATETEAEDHIDWIEENGENGEGHEERGYYLAPGEYTFPSYEVLQLAA